MLVTRDRRPQYTTEQLQYAVQQSPAKTFKSSGAQHIIGFRPPEHRPVDEGKHPFEGGDQMLEFKVERILSVEVPLKVKPLQDTLSVLQVKVAKMDDLTSRVIGDIRSRVTDIEYNIKAVADRSTAHREETQRMMNELNQANARTRDFVKEAITRLTALEGRFTIIEEELRNISQKQQHFEHKVAHQIMKINTNIDHVKRTANENVQGLATQVESLNRETQATFNSVGRQISNVSSVMADSINQLSSTTRESLQILRSDNDEILARIERQIEQSTAETAQAVHDLENEIAQTFSVTKSLITNSHTSLEAAITTESTTRKQNDQQLVDTYSAINATLANNTRALETLDVKPHVERECAAILDGWKSDISACMRDLSNTISACQDRTSALEKKMDKVRHKHKSRKSARIEDVVPDNDQTNGNHPLEDENGEMPFDERPVGQGQSFDVPEYENGEMPFDERPVGQGQAFDIPEYENGEIPFDERPVGQGKPIDIPEYDDGPNMCIVSNGMTFRRRPNDKTSGDGVKVMIAEPRMPKKPMGMVLSLHGKYHSGRSRSKVARKPVELGPDPDSTPNFPTFADEPSLAECAFLNDSSRANRRQKRK